MHNNKLWLLFLTLITLAMGWFTWQTVSKTKNYLALSQKTNLSDITWSAVKKGEDHYLLVANFSYVIGENKIDKTELQENPVYPNPWAAKLAASKQATKYRQVWYAPNNPKQASLNKNFPTKELISTLILLALWSYFLWLGFYVTKFSK